MEFRREWLEIVVRRCQTLTGSIFHVDNTDELVRIAAAWIDSVPDPIARAEDLALRGMLCDIAVRWSDVIHNHGHPERVRRRCGFLTTYGLDRFGACGHRSAKESFMDWVRTFSKEFVRTHPLSAAQRAAAILRQQDGHRADIPTIASLVGVTADQLRRGFVRERGVTLPEYVRRIKLLRALEVLADGAGKIEPLALEVGYRSKKNFYHAFKQLTGLTPLAFKQLPQDSARQIVETTRLGLMRKN
jgi:AraC-like DNA-binding protein